MLAMVTVAMAVVMINMAVMMRLRVELVVLMVTTQSVGSVEHDVSLCSTMVMVTMVVMVIPMLVMVTVVLVVVLMITCSEVHDVSLPRGDTGAEIETLVS